MSQVRWVTKTCSREEGLGFEQLARTGKCKLTGSLERESQTTVLSSEMGP